MEESALERFEFIMDQVMTEITEEKVVLEVPQENFAPMMDWVDASDLKLFENYDCVWILIHSQDLSLYEVCSAFYYGHSDKVNNWLSNSFIDVKQSFSEIPHEPKGWTAVAFEDALFLKPYKVGN
ncbi:hypothetical protein CAL7716_057880 [Calothrix sp. PCC 7716]|nr:hypothetical protein CAL7716_057880 [Calothrix sp. PCC 7716]